MEVKVADVQVDNQLANMAFPTVFARALGSRTDAAGVQASAQGRSAPGAGVPAEGNSAIAGGAPSTLSTDAAISLSQLQDLLHLSVVMHGNAGGGQRDIAYYEYFGLSLAHMDINVEDAFVRRLIMFGTTVPRRAETIAHRIMHHQNVLVV